MSKIKDIPDVIFLQVDPDDGVANHYGPDVVFNNLDEMTWCVDRIDDSDIKYIRATPERELAPDMHKLLQRLYARVQFHASTVWAVEDADKNWMSHILAVINDLGKRVSK